MNFEMPKLDAAAWENSKYHKGGFEPKMTKREAALILGVSPNANVKRVGFFADRNILWKSPIISDPRLTQKGDDSQPP